MTEYEVPKHGYLQSYKEVEDEMEKPDLTQTGIGNKPVERLKAAECIVTSVDTEYVEKAKLYKAVIFLKHPSKEESIKISSATVARQKKGKKEIVSAALWIPLDKDNKIQMETTLAKVLTFYNVSILKELVEKKVQTEVDEDGYLTLKAY